MSIKRKYIAVDAQSKESTQEVRLTNQNNVLHGKEMRILNPESQQMEDVRDIFFSKEDGRQIAETIKEEVKQDIQGEYITQEDAEKFAAKEDVQEAVDDVKSLAEQTYLKKEDAEDIYAKKEDVQDIVKRADFSEIAKIDLESEYTLADVAAKVNEILDALKGSYGSDDEGGEGGEGGQGSGGNEPTVNPDPGEGDGEENDNIGTKTRITYIPESELEPVELSITGTLSSSQIEYKTSIKTVEVGRGVTSIGESAFDGCKFLTEVTLPEGLTTIQSSAFAECSKLETINIPSTTRVIGDSAFQDCSSLTNITLPRGLITIGDEAFFRSGLTEVIVPNTVSDFQGMVFWHCENLTNITIGNSVSQIDSFNGCTSLNSITIGDNVYEIGDNAFYTCTNLNRLTLTRYTMDEVKSQAYVEHHAWGIPVGCLVICIDGQFISEEEKLTKITYTEESELEPVELYIVGTANSNNIPNANYIKTIEFGSSISGIASNTFSGSLNLQMIRIPDNCNLGSYAFSHCSNLTDLIIVDRVSLGEFPFAASGIQRVTFLGKTMSEARSLVSYAGNQWRLATGTEVICSDGTFTIQ